MSFRYLDAEGEPQVVESDPQRCKLLSPNLALVNDKIQPYAALKKDDEVQIWWGGQAYSLPLASIARRSRQSTRRGGGLSLVAQMPGTILTLMVQLGEDVEAGQPLVLMESMKMELSLESPSSGTVAEILCQVGARVDRGATLIRLEPRA